MMKNKIALFWHRRDLRFDDNAGLYKALKSGHAVLPIFIFDQNILDKLPENDQRVLFIHQNLEKLKSLYQALGSDLAVFYGKPKEIYEKLLSNYQIAQVYTNRDYEPYALERDREIYELLQKNNIELIGAKDHVIFEKNEVMKNDGLPYTVFTPYSRKWKDKLNPFYLKPYPNQKYAANLYKFESTNWVMLNEMGFSSEQQQEFPSNDLSLLSIERYGELRDIPSIKGTSRLSVHLRFGTISIRELAQIALKKNSHYLNELIWRDFYQMIIYHFPNSVHQSFKPQYDRIVWENNEAHFKAWCEGKTGYPIVDAGMRELNETGFMHNRVRMITASFLTKHLLIDWRWGEAYFAEKLQDFELASNVGGWQWAASSGCDAAPYFRVFNPELQTEKFDKELKYIKKWVPEYGTSAYPKPIVEHKFARERVLARFKDGLG
jgi:deoxyribodipyrimidine photo-lyase